MFLHRRLPRRGKERARWLPKGKLQQLLLLHQLQWLQPEHQQQLQVVAGLVAGAEVGEGKEGDEAEHNARK